MTNALSAALAFITCALAAPAALAQQGPESGGGEKITQAIVYGDDKCPVGGDDEILVCAKLPEADRYRVPEIFRGDPLSPKNQAWTQRVVALERNGRFGTDSCSPVGLGGFTGCMGQMIDGAYAERRATDKTNWEALIAEERAKRLAGIDAAAADVEAAVTAEEKAMAERERRAQELEDRGGAPVDETPLPQPKG
jgi:hypothetical protein